MNEIIIDFAEQALNSLPST